MKTRCLAALASLLLTYAMAAPAAAGVSPYVRLDYGGSEFRMSAIDDNIDRMATSVERAGIPADIKHVGSGYGPSASAGVWLFPGFRVGATCGLHRAVRSNVAYEDSVYFFQDELDLKFTDVGAEAAVRFQALGGLTAGVNLSRGRAELVENLTELSSTSSYYLAGTARGYKNSYGAFVGIDQTNERGLAGFVRLGYVYRDVGRLPSTIVESDGFTDVTTKSKTSWLDYSGFYLKVGVGFDLVK
jgi:hypothetical protein